MTHENTLHTLKTPLTWATQSLHATLISQKAFKSSCEVNACKPLHVGRAGLAARMGVRAFQVMSLVLGWV
jgi:hypothetical protein